MCEFKEEFIIEELIDIFLKISLLDWKYINQIIQLNFLEFLVNVLENYKHIKDIPQKIMQIITNLALEDIDYIVLL